jgi:hypothetical protein
MSCEEGMYIDGVSFGEETYSTIVMCCESAINSVSGQKLTASLCKEVCGTNEIWYPLYNAFGPNTMHDSLLSYMVRELLEPVRNGNCKVGQSEDVFASQGYTKI